VPTICGDRRAVAPEQALPLLAALPPTPADAPAEDVAGAPPRGPTPDVHADGGGRPCACDVGTTGVAQCVLMGEFVSAEQKLSDVLSDFARTMATDFPIQAILDHLITRIEDMLPISAAGVTLIASDEIPHYFAASDRAALSYERLQTEMGVGPCLLAYRTGDNVLIPDLRDELRFPEFTARALQDGIRAMFTFPLCHGDRRLGALDLYRDTPGALSPQSLGAAQTLANVTAAYLINAQARETLKDSSERSRELSLHDGLTGLPNRTLMLDRLEQAFQRTRRTGKTSAVMFVDLDGFKAVNDTHGHSAGNQLLIAVATRLRGVLRPPDTVARMHGDEFVILCEDLDHVEQAAPIVLRLAEALAETFALPMGPIDITASIGVAFAGPDVHDAEQVLRDADAAMYQAKRRGGGEQQVFDPRYQHVAKGLQELTRDLRGAVRNNELAAVYQPIVGIADGAIRGFEALLRWEHPTLGTVPPLTFIPLAEQSALITDIGAWILRQACADRGGWQRRQPDVDVSVSVNISTPQLMSPSFIDTVAATLQAENTPPARLTLEITESVFVQDSDHALAVLHDLKDLGVQIALDDFGTGYSSLKYLSRFPVDTVKIDRSFIANLGHDRVNDIIAAAVVQLAHALDMTVVAEGIETVEQHHEVAALGCDAGQGYFYARPMPAGPADRLVLPRVGENLAPVPALT
jgi:diguanylate cyclase (GGDEF)-like protein